MKPVLEPWHKCVWFIFLCWLPVQAEESDGLFTASSDLQMLLWTEAKLVSSLRDYIQAEEERLKKLKG